PAPCRARPPGVLRKTRIAPSCAPEKFRRQDKCDARSVTVWFSLDRRLLPTAGGIRLAAPRRLVRLAAATATGFRGRCGCGLIRLLRRGRRRHDDLVRRRLRIPRRSGRTTRAHVLRL